MTERAPLPYIFGEGEEQPAAVYIANPGRSADPDTGGQSVDFRLPGFSEHPGVLLERLYDRLQWHGAADPSHATLLRFAQYGALKPMSPSLWLDPTADITDAATADDVLSILRRQGLDKVADRVAELSRLHDTDPDEPQLDVASLREMATALIRNPKLRAPQLTITEKGFMHAEWRTVEDGALAMTFLPSGRIEFGAISASALSGAEILRLGGLHLGSVVTEAVQWYTARIAT